MHAFIWWVYVRIRCTKFQKKKYKLPFTRLKLWKMLPTSPPTDLRKSVVPSYRLATCTWLVPPCLILSLATETSTSPPLLFIRRARRPAPPRRASRPSSFPRWARRPISFPSSAPPHLLPVERTFCSPSSCAPPASSLSASNRSLRRAWRPCSSRRVLLLLLIYLRLHLRRALPAPPTDWLRHHADPQVPLLCRGHQCRRRRWRYRQRLSRRGGHGTVIFLLVLMLIIVVNILMISCKDIFWNRNYFLLNNLLFLLLINVVNTLLIYCKDFFGMKLCYCKHPNKKCWFCC
jgi:hypothetical protein